MTPRLAPIDPATAPDDIAEFLTAAATGTGGATNIFATMANHPALMRRYLPFGGKLLLGGVLDPRTRELAILRTAWNCSSDYEWGQHARIGREIGLTDDEIVRVTSGPGDPGWTSDEATVLDACDELAATHTISEPTWDRLAERLDARGLVELTLLIGHYVMIAGMLNALGVEREPGVESFPCQPLVAIGHLDIGPVAATELEPLFDLFGRIVGSGEGYPHAPPLTRAVFDATWVHPVTTVVAGRLDGRLAGAYYLRPNQPGRAAHIANAGYVVDEPFRGQGVGRALVLDSIERAPRFGFDAIQFNLVFESNPARRLYEELGWIEIGRVPRAVEGEDAILYWRSV